jgi:hypothetical protein
MFSRCFLVGRPLRPCTSDSGGCDSSARIGDTKSEKKTSKFALCGNFMRVLYVLDPVWLVWNRHPPSPSND